MSTEQTTISRTHPWQAFQLAQSRLHEAASLVSSFRSASSKPAKGAKSKQTGTAKTVSEGESMLDEMLFCRAVGNLEGALRFIATRILWSYPALLRSDAISFETMMHHEDLQSLLSAMIEMKVAYLLTNGPERLEKLLEDHVRFQLFPDERVRTKVHTIFKQRSLFEFAENHEAVNFSDAVSFPEAMKLIDSIIAELPQRLNTVFSMDLPISPSN
jgi:hypothetical protein